MNRAVFRLGLILGALLACIHALPVEPQAPFRPFASSHSTDRLGAPTMDAADDNGAISAAAAKTISKETLFHHANVDVHRFVSLLASHVVVEHLDSAASVLAKHLSVQIQDAVQLSSDPLAVHPPTMILASDWVNDQVDVRLLHEQLRGAVGSYVQDQMPHLWNRHSAAAALNITPLHDTMTATLVDYCPPIDSESTSAVITYACLSEHAVAFLSSMDDYMKDHLHNTLTRLVQTDIPTLLTMANHHVDAILQHFNMYLLPPHTQLHFNFMSLQDQIQTWASSSNINQVLDTIASSETNSDALIVSISHYAMQARTTADDD
ncbi:hypothetical protein BC940DRAFT_303047 [Gongronella butleri]|nr:hypothetical protein BC940DRAFT_303047 [Gongronella butleri]